MNNRAILLIFITWILSCKGDVVLSSGEISFDLSGTKQQFDENIQGQFYIDKSYVENKEKYRYIFTGWNYDDCCLLIIRTASEDRDQTLFVNEQLDLSFLAVSDNSYFNNKAGDYDLDRGEFNILSRNENSLKAKFDLYFVEKSEGLDTVHLSNGELLIHDLEEHHGKY